MRNMKEKKNPKYIKKANTFVYILLRAIFRPALYLLYRFKFDYITSKAITCPCLILSNHQTVFDQFAVGLGFSFGINYIASDTLFRRGLLSWFMKALGRPIPFSKGNSDLIAVKNIMSVIKSGGAVGMFPSGNRSFYGEESTIAKGIGKLAKKLNVPLVLVRMHGGFNVKPRWKAKPNRGEMRAGVVRVVSREELTALSHEEADELIHNELYFNEFEFNRTAKLVYTGQHKAEYLESVLFYCPQCNSMESLYSQGNEFLCRACNMKVRIGETGFLEKVTNAYKIPDTILEWSRIQINYIKKHDFSVYTEKPAFRDNNTVFTKAERAKKETSLGKGTIEFFADKMSICGHDFLFTETTWAVQGVRKLTVYNKGNVYAINGPYRINFMKYMICGYHLRNKFLGITEEYYGY